MSPPGRRSGERSCTCSGSPGADHCNPLSLFILFTLQILGGADHPVCVRVLQGVWSGNDVML